MKNSLAQEHPREWWAFQHTIRLQNKDRWLEWIEKGNQVPDPVLRWLWEEAGHLEAGDLLPSVSFLIPEASVVVGWQFTEGSDPVPGDIYINPADNTLHVFDGKNWNLL